MILEKFTQEDYDNPDFFEAIEMTETVEAKELPFDDKVRLFKRCFEEEGLRNPSLISNVLMIVRGCSLDDELFAKKEVVFKNLEEYLDVKFELKDEIKQFDTRILQYFFGALKGISYMLPDKKEDIPNLYFHTLLVIDISTISKMMNRTSVSFDNAPLVTNSEAIINSICSKNALVSGLMEKLVAQIKLE